jgi:hypothetical protein
LAGIPKVPVPLISKAVIHCATSTDETTDSGMWMLNGGDDVILIRKHQRELSQGVYKLLNARLEETFKHVGRLQSYRMIVGDIMSLLVEKKIHRLLILFSVVASAIALQRYLPSENLLRLFNF